MPIIIPGGQAHLPAVMVGLVSVRNPSIGRILIWTNNTDRPRRLRLHSPVGDDVFLAFTQVHVNFNDCYLLDESVETMIVLGPGQSLYAIHAGGNNKVVEVRVYVEAL